MLALARQRYQESPCWCIINTTVLGGLCSGMVLAGIVLCFLPNYGPMEGMVLIVAPFISLSILLIGILAWMGYKKARQMRNPTATAVAPALPEPTALTPIQV